MNDVATMPAQERAELFIEAAETPIPVRAPALIEKDFWLCWVLGHVFADEAPFQPLIFKGGTSLTKVYQAIERFSEDIDLSIDRTILGFEGERDPGSARTGKQAKRRLEELGVACREFVQGPLRRWLTARFASILGDPDIGTDSWAIEIDDRDPDGQTLLFRYPRTAVTAEASGYIAPEIRLEFGARGETWPSERATIRSYIADAFPSEFGGVSAGVQVLAIERTFGEKATILHAIAHGGAERVRPRQARHYYDLARLAAGTVRERALSNLDLLEAVARHKARFFRAAWAKYDLARPGTLRLTPPADVERALRADCHEMEAMFFSTPPSFDEILEQISMLEAIINASGQRLA